MRTLSRRPRVQTWCARKRTLTSLELGRDGKIQIPKHPSSSAYGFSAISSLSFCRTLKSGINQYQYQYQYQNAFAFILNWAFAAARLAILKVIDMCMFVCLYLW